MPKNESPEFLPLDKDAEGMVLSMALFDRTVFGRIQHYTATEDFGLERHRIIWLACLAVAQKGLPVACETVADHLVSSGQIASAGGVSALFELDHGLASIFGIEHWMKRLREAGARRRAVLMGRSLIGQCQDTQEPAALLESITKMQREMSALTALPEDDNIDGIRHVINMAGGMDRFFERTTPAVTTPWPEFNEILGGGFRPGELIVLAGRPGKGKSAMSLQIALHAASQGVNIRYFTLEMSREALTQRASFSRAGVNSHLWKHGMLSREEKRRAQKAAAEIDCWPFRFAQDTSWDIGKIQSYLNSLTVKPGFVVVDYLQRINTDDSVNYTLALGYVSRGLKQAAMELKIPILLLSTLNREADKEKPALHHLRYSGDIEADADTVVLVYSDPKIAESAVRRTEFNVAKNRDGLTGYFYLDFNSPYVRFESPDQD